jgi:hypothetical protein
MDQRRGVDEALVATRWAVDSRERGLGTPVALRYREGRLLEAAGELEAAVGDMHFSHPKPHVPGPGTRRETLLRTAIPRS